jgi:hypothetical protein
MVSVVEVDMPAASIVASVVESGAGEAMALTQRGKTSPYLLPRGTSVTCTCLGSSEFSTV